MKAYCFRDIAIVSLVSFFIVCGCCLPRVFAGGKGSQETKRSQGAYPCFYQELFRADGSLSEWPSKMFYDNADANLLYAIANDSSRLYFCIQVLDPDEQLSILHDGFSFTIEANGKKKESCLVKFPFGEVRPYGAPPAAGPGDRPDQGSMNAQVREKKNPQAPPKGIGTVRQRARRFQANVSLSGFCEGIDGTYSPLSLLPGVETALAYDSTGSLVIETAIPLSYFKEDLRTAKYLTLGFVIKNSVSGKPQEGQGVRPGGGGAEGSGGIQIEGTGGQAGMSGGIGSAQGGGQGGSPGGGQGGMGGGPGGGQGGMGGGPGGGGHGGGPGGEPPRDSGSQSQSKNFKISHKFSIAPRP